MKRKLRSTRKLARLWCLVTLAILIALPAMASDTGDAEEHGGEASHHKHALGLFLGVTREHSENHGTLGIEYAYRINRRWSVGGVIERADRERESTLGIVFVHYWPYKGLFFGGGIGRKDPVEERENVARATLGYEFEFHGGWMLNLQANLDFIENNDREEVYGVAFGRTF